MSSIPLHPKASLIEKNSTKELIITILSTEWPLTTKELSYRVQKLSSKPITYKATHKTITQLVTDGVLVKDSTKKIQLSFDWIKDIKQFGSLLQSNYLTKQKIDFKQLHKKEQINLTFENPLELGVFLCNYFFHYPNPKNKPTTMHITNNYPLIGMSIKDVIALRKSMSKTKIYCLIANDTIIDRFLANFYIVDGTEFKFGVKCAGSCDIIVRSDYVCNVYWPKKLMKQWTKLNKKVKYLKNFNLNDWFSLIHDKWGLIHINIIKNPSLAEKIRKETIAYFK